MGDDCFSMEPCRGWRNLSDFFPARAADTYAMLYLFMGWSGLFIIKQVLASMSISQTVLLFTGAGAFTAGGIIYAIKNRN